MNRSGSPCRSEKDSNRRASFLLKESARSSQGVQDSEGEDLRVDRGVTLKPRPMTYQGSRV